MKGDRREIIRKRLDTLYLPYYDALCENLNPEWQPYSGFRSLEQQAALYAKGRSLPGPIVTKAPPGSSAHNYGCASDWTLFDENDYPIWIKQNNPRWKEYEMACDKAGVLWGGTFAKILDYFHNELRIKTPWSRVKQVQDEKGADEAYDFIKSNIGGS